MNWNILSCSELLEVFFEKSFENEISDNCLENNYVFPQKDILEYIDVICGIPYEQLIESAPTFASLDDISSEDITQASNFEAFTSHFCKVIIEDGDWGYNCHKLGQLLQNDGIKRTKVADTKYGENQAKTALQLGLAYCLYDTWYVSCLGRVYNLLSLEKQTSLLARTLLRNKLYATILKESKKCTVDIAKYLTCISMSTRCRRATDVKKLLAICIKQCNSENIDIHPFVCSLTSQRERKDNNKAVIIPLEDAYSQDKSDDFISVAADGHTPGLMSQQTELFFKKNVDWSLFSQGTNIPKKCHKLFEGMILPGEQKNVVIILSGKQYDARIYRTPNGQVYQLLYGSQRELLKQLQEIFSTAYSHFLDKRSQNDNHGLLISKNDYIEISHIGSDTFVFKCNASYSKQVNDAIPSVSMQQNEQSIVSRAWSYDSQMWFRLSEWSRINKFFDAKQRNLIHALGRKKANNSAFSFDKALEGVQLLDLAIDKGFDTGEKSASTATENGDFDSRCDFYVQQFSIMNVATKNGVKAPHKAVMILAVMNMIECHSITKNRIELTQQLLREFSDTWYENIPIQYPFQCSPIMPFKHLNHEPFWTLVSDKEFDINNHQGELTRALINENDIYAKLDDDLFDIMKDEKCRIILRDYLIRTYLPLIVKPQMERWIFPSNPLVFDLPACFHEVGCVFWRQKVSIHPGDIVYIYSTTPDKRITYKLLVEKVDMPVSEIKDDQKFWVSKEEYQKSITQNRYCKLSVIKRYMGNELSLDKLRENGLLMAPQGAMHVPPKLLKFIEAH